MGLRIARIYQKDPHPRQEHRILVDRLWPRGITKEEAELDDWMPEVGPSDWLRWTFGHDETRWGTFRSRYLRQLRSKKRLQLLEKIAELARKEDVVLLYGARSEEHNQAVVIREALAKWFGVE
jgi:uncharacterized protein YeaO (DUF488 family)